MSDVVLSNYLVFPLPDMSMTMSPSSSLRILERHNHSKSTVSSSDTDVDSAGYASSSGTTTPEDDAQMFDLGHTFQNVLANKPNCAPRDKLTIVTKHRNLSSAMKKVKEAVHALGVFKKKRPDDMSPILRSSPLRERFGKRMSVKPHPDEGFYSLPNRRFSLSDLSRPSDHSRTMIRKFGTISGSTSGFVKGRSRKERSGLRMPNFSDSQRSAPPPPTTTAVPRTEHDVLTFGTILAHALRILFFVPWCAAVGGVLLLFPSYVECVTFRPGYLVPSTGIRRFAYWAECGQQHVMIFLACLLAVLWYNYTLGLSLTSIVVSRFVCVWRAFEVDRRIPLGEDDQQSLYLVIMGLASADGSFSMAGSRGGQTERKTDHSAY